MLQQILYTQIWRYTSNGYNFAFRHVPYVKLKVGCSPREKYMVCMLLSPVHVFPLRICTKTGSYAEVDCRIDWLPGQMPRFSTFLTYEPKCSVNHCKNRYFGY